MTKQNELDISLQVDGGRMDIIFSSGSCYCNNTVTMEQAVNLARDILALVNKTAGDKSPRLYDAENERLEETIFAINTLNRLRDKAGKAVDELNKFFKGGE